MSHTCDVIKSKFFDIKRLFYNFELFSKIELLDLFRYRGINGFKIN